MNTIFNHLENILSNLGIEYGSIPYLRLLILIGALVLLSIICFYITKYWIIHPTYKIMKKTKFQWDDEFVKQKAFDSFAHLVPAIIVKKTAPFIMHDFDSFIPFISHAADIYIIFVAMIISVSFLKVIETSLSKSSVFINKPISSYFQLLRIILYIIVAILVISILIGKSPLYLLSAFGAISAILLLIFKDTILGLVASVQLSSNDMIRVGDWIEIPKFNVDGEVIIINLNTVKIQNWDKTITTVPTYYFITDSFKNWRGMQQSGGRRIKRAIYVNARSVKFIDKSFPNRFQNLPFINDYITEKQPKTEISLSIFLPDNKLRITNVEIFRHYIENYLNNIPELRKDMTLKTNELPITEQGLPIEICCFVSISDNNNYDEIQASIIDHILAVVPYFELEIFQIPSGEDIIKLKQTFLEKH